MAKNTDISGQPVICQLLSFIPSSVIGSAVAVHQSDYYYKTMTTYRQLVFLLYGVVARCHSLRNLCKGLLFLDGKLSYLGINKLPACSTLSDANIKAMYLEACIMDYMSTISHIYRRAIITIHWRGS